MFFGLCSFLTLTIEQVELAIGSSSNELCGFWLLLNNYSVIASKETYQAWQDHEGGIFNVEASLHASNVQVVDQVIGYGCTRLKFRPSFDN
ncbi:hypothetical protein DVH24_016841 [Malus domestica]|uniref:Large ribosomal subunit protein uL24 C-terminal domain-containing protein n=1 Tax=Malus domestica TaxID=3750 RepID=A0A498HTA6_MALDO|nr:hypothetical protein DVH24_016841 [Malus domestica]